MKFAVIGCGSIGRRHISNLLSLGHEVVAWNRSPARRVRVEKDYSIQIFDELADLLAQGADAAVVCSPNHLHIEHASLALAAGHHLFIEKPISDCFEGLAELEEGVKRANKIVHVGCNMRFHFGPRRVKDILVNGIIGRPLWASIWGGMHLPDWHPDEDYRDMYSAKVEEGGGAVLDFIHELDLLIWLLGEPNRLAAVVSRSGWLEIETEDVADVVMQFPAGMTAMLHVDYLQRPFQRGIRIVGEEGWVEWNLARETVERFRHSSRQLVIQEMPLGWQTNDMYVAQMEYFIDCLSEGRRSDSSLKDGRVALELAMKVKQSSQENRFIMEERC